MARILMVFQPADGGVFRHVEELADGLAAHGHEVLACGTRRPDAIAEERFVPLSAGRGIDLTSDGGAMAQVARVVRRLAPDLVHLHSSKAGALGRLARWAAPATPVVYSPHGYAFAGHFRRATERRAYKAVEVVLAPLASRVLCVCEAERRLACAVGAAARTRTVYNGITPVAPGPLHDAVRDAKANHRPVVAVVTPLRPGKGVETLIDAMPAVLRQHPTASLLIAGDGAESERLRRRAHEVGLGAAVRFLGEVRDPTTVLAGGDVVVHPSWAESFPYAVLEAMSVGAPIVASDVGGTREAIEDGRSGLLVSPRDAAALARAVGALLADADRARSLGDAARERAERRFTLAQMVSGTLGVYAEVSGRVRGDDRTSAPGALTPSGLSAP